MKNRKGITLIALVVTIVVLLILASITIGTLTGENSAITKSQEAKKNQEISQEREIVEISATQASERDKFGEIKKENLKEALTNNVGETKYKLSEDKEKFTIVFTDSTSKTEHYIWKDVPILTNANVTFKYNPSTWTNGNVTATVSTTVIGYSIQTSQDNKTWSTTNQQIFSKNGTIYVRLINTNGQYSRTITGNVTNIDKTKPIVTDVTATTNSIKLTATDEASGIIGYTVTTNNTIPSSFTSCTNTKTLNVTVGNKKQNTTYYIWVKDQAGNVSLAKTIKTEKVPDLTTANVEFTYSPSGWTNGNVVATATTTVNGYTLQTSTDNKIWTTTNNQTYTTNGTIYARLIDSTNQTGGVATGNVTNIDKTNPIVTGATVTTNSIRIEATDEASGIIGYTVTTNNTIPSSFTSCTNTKTLNVTVGNKKQNTTYYIWVKDEAGNISVSKQTQTGTVPTPAVTFAYNPSDWTRGNVITTVNTTTSGYTLETSLNNSSWSATNQQTRSDNGPVYARLKDSTGQVGGVATGNVTNIDKTVPSIARAEIKNISSSGYDVYVYGVTDTQSGVNRVQFPTWTTYNWQDDLQPNWDTNSSATGINQGNGIWYYRVNTNAHNNESGEYKTDIYVYDNVGNSSCVSTLSANVPVPYVVLASVARPGDYIRYIPNNASYTCPSGANGHSNQTINSSSYNGLWRILYNDGTFGLQITSDRSVANLTGRGVTWWENVIPQLNNISKIYMNSYAIDYRYIGTNPYNKADDTQYGLTYTGPRYTDHDTRAMNEATSQNSDGIFDIYTDDSKTTKKIYYIGTRQKYTYTSSNIKHKEYGIVESGSNPYNRSTHSFTGDYKDTVFRLVKNDDYNNAHDGTETFGLRPVIKLNTATKVTGSGTKNDPFVIHGL